MKNPDGDQNPQGPQMRTRIGWTPAIPTPLFLGLRLRRCECRCGLKFRNHEAYRGHFTLVHILGLS